MSSWWNDVSVSMVCATNMHDSSCGQYTPFKTLRSPGGVHILAEDRRHILKTHGVQGWASTHGLRRHVGVSRHMPGEDSEDTRASEDTFPAKTRVGRRVFAKTPPERAVLAKACPEVKP